MGQAVGVCIWLACWPSPLCPELCLLTCEVGKAASPWPAHPIRLKIEGQEALPLA